jgi:predicted DNA-binding transcriptional regulator AlpA
VGKRILRPAESQARLGIGRTQFYEFIASGRLGPPLRLGPKSVGHLETEIDGLIDRLVAERDAKIAQRKAAPPRTRKQHTNRK